jgi:hypothetical protein
VSADLSRLDRLISDFPKKQARFSLISEWHGPCSRNRYREVRAKGLVGARSRRRDNRYGNHARACGSSASDVHEQPARVRQHTSANDLLLRSQPVVTH